MKAIISIVALATAFLCVSAHELRGGPNLLSGVVMNDADLKTEGESPEWYPKTKFFADIPKMKGRTDPWNHKAGTANIIKKINKTKLVNEVHMYHKTVAVGGNPNPLLPLLGQEAEKPCSDDRVKFEGCLRSEGMSDDEVLACSECIDSFLDTTLFCDYWCSNFQACKITCTKEFTTTCWDDAIDMAGCVTEYNGCEEFESKCYPLNPDDDEPDNNNNPVPSPAPKNDPLPSPAPFYSDTDSETEPDQVPRKPCSDDRVKFEGCLRSEGMSDDEVLACSECIDSYLDTTLFCDYWCSDFQACKITCTKEFTTTCWDDAIDMAGCVTEYNGCEEFESKCYPLNPDDDESDNNNNPVPSPAPNNDPIPSPAPFYSDSDSETEPDQVPRKPCSDDRVKFEGCLRSEGMSDDEVLACSECIDSFLDTTLFCDYWCSDFQACKITCTKEFTTTCWDDAIDMVGCVTEYNGCGGFESNCYPLNPDDDDLGGGGLPLTLAAPQVLSDVALAYADHKSRGQGRVKSLE